MTTVTPPIESINDKTKRLNSEIIEADLAGTLAIVRNDHDALVAAWHARLAASTELLAIETAMRHYLEVTLQAMEARS